LTVEQLRERLSLSACARGSQQELPLGGVLEGEILMATQGEVPKKRSGLFASSLTSLNVGAGEARATAAPSPKPEEANSATEPAQAQQAAPRYLTTSGLFEIPPRPPAWKEADLRGIAPNPAPAGEPSQLVNEFRSTLIDTRNQQEERPRKSRKGIIALAVVGIFLAATAAAIYMNHPKKSVAELHTTKVWVAKKWKAGIAEISSVFHSQASAQANNKTKGQRPLSPLLKGRRSANVGVVSASLWETRPDGRTDNYGFQATDPFGRHWVPTPTGQELGPTNHLGTVLK
jgi:hypothetical protein